MAKRSVAKRVLGPLMAAVLMALAFWALNRELSGTSLSSLGDDLRLLPRLTLLVAVGLTVLNYFVLSGYDVLATRYAGAKLPYRRVGLASVIGFSFSQSLGFPILTGTPVRYRLYSTWGVEGATVARIVAFYVSTFWVSSAAVGGLAFMLWPVSLPSFVLLPSSAVRPLGALMLVGLVVYVVWALRGKGEIRVGRLHLDVPEPKEVAGQIALGALDWVTAAAVLWVLLPDGHELGMGTFLSVYLLAQVVGMVSQVPGGLGVFEALFLVLIPASFDESAFLASMLVFRAIYYVLPLLIGFALLAVHELMSRRESLVPGAIVMSRWASGLVPMAAASVSFILGSVLLISGSVPIESGRLATIGRVLPLPLLELSHFLGSVVGVALLILARGLQRRMDGAYHVTLWFLLAAVVLSLTRGLPISATITLGLVTLLLYGSRRQFYRPASLLDESFSPAWIIAIGMTVAVSWWLGTFAFAGIDFASDVWWRFALSGDAPRFLRATVGVVMTLVAFLGARMLHPAPPPMEPPSVELIESVAPLVAAAPSVDANLVYLRDKQVLTSESGRSFLMFVISGSSWVVMGDPVGDEAEFANLLWAFRERVDLAGGEVVMYKVRPHFLPLYIDLGLSPFKLGEEGRVPLGDFSLAGGKRADFRKALTKLEQAGGTFQVVPASETAPLMPRLREISDDWLQAKSTREKGFSLGRFDESYLARFPIAVISVGSQIVAFSNIWANDPLDEVSVDLMRYSSDAPRNVMDALFAKLLLWSKEQGYEVFSVGLAPLSGMETHRLAPAWQRFGHLVFRYGENFYNFQGLRDFKEKFDPVWEPRYLAAPSGLALPGVLADVTTLIAGGLKGVVAR